MRASRRSRNSFHPCQPCLGRPSRQERGGIVAAHSLKAASQEGGDESAGGARTDSCNAILPELAKEAGAGFIALPAMPEHYTIDGIHLNAAGDAVLDRAISPGVDASICKSA